MLILKSLGCLRPCFYKLAYFSATATNGKSAKKTYYQLLEVPTSATMANIKNNYLRLAKIYHPDVYRGKDKDRFQKIQEAYKVLIDKLKRAKYDEEHGIGISTAQDQDPLRHEQAGQETGKPRNPMSYDKSEQKLDLDEEYRKFFSQKPKTQFQQIRLNEEPEIRSMSEAERLRRHFTGAYESPDTLAKAGYQKEFDTIINDQINQKNRMYEEGIKNQEKIKAMHSQKGIKSARLKVLAIFTLAMLTTTPLLLSYITKYRLEEERKKQILQHDRKLEERAQQVDLKLRLKYE